MPTRFFHHQPECFIQDEVSRRVRVALPASICYNDCPALQFGPSLIHFQLDCFHDDSQGVALQFWVAEGESYKLCEVFLVFQVDEGHFKLIALLDVFEFALLFCCLHLFDDLINCQRLLLLDQVHQVVGPFVSHSDQKVVPPPIVARLHLLLLALSLCEEGLHLLAVEPEGREPPLLKLPGEGELLAEVAEGNDVHLPQLVVEIRKGVPDKFFFHLLVDCSESSWAHAGFQIDALGAHIFSLEQSLVEVTYDLEGLGVLSLKFQRLKMLRANQLLPGEGKSAAPDDIAPWGAVGVVVEGDVSFHPTTKYNDSFNASVITQMNSINPLRKYDSLQSNQSNL